jgi:hypothetical protein
MQPGYPLRLDVAEWAVVVFVLATLFFSGVLAGYLMGLTHLVRHGDARHGGKNIWGHEDEN